MITVVWLGGIGEQVVVGEGVSGTFLGALDQARFEVVNVPYPAEYGDPDSYIQSRAIGRANAIQAIKNTPNLAVLGGYSAGAEISGDLARDIGAARDPELSALKVLGCSLMADPSRPFGQGGTPIGYGISGQRGIVGLPTWWVANPTDPITCLDPGSALRLIADFTGLFSLDPRQWFAWLQSLPQIIAANEEQHWWEHTNPLEILNAGNELVNYMFAGQHTTRYIEGGYAQRLADTVNGAFPDA